MVNIFGVLARKFLGLAASFDIWLLARYGLVLFKLDFGSLPFSSFVCHKAMAGPFRIYTSVHIPQINSSRSVF